jgi:hypothetical protein
MEEVAEVVAVAGVASFLTEKQEVAVDDVEIPQDVLDKGGVDVETLLKKYRPSLDLSAEEDLYSAAIGAGVGLIKGQGPVTYLIAVLLLNFVVQIGLCAYTFNYVVLPNVDSARQLYKKFHEEVFDESGPDSFDEERWNAWKENSEDDYLALCQLPLSNPWFQCLILWLWTITIMQDFLANWKNAKVVLNLRTGGTMSAEEDTITTITTEARIACVIVCVVRAGISLFLLLEGFLWLSSTTSFEDLILNAVALAFILDVDGFLYSFGLPPKMRESLANVPVADLSEETRIRDTMEKGDTAAAAELVHAYASGANALWNRARWLLVSLSSVYAYVFYNALDWLPYTTVLPGFAHDVHAHCDGTFKSISEITCGTVRCSLDFDSCTEQCFPYGSQR